MKFLSITLLFIATIWFYGCSNDSKCEALMAKLFSSNSSEYASGGCIDAKHAYLYSYDEPKALMFVSVNKNTFIIDSVIDFNHSFAKYASMEELKQARISKYDSLPGFSELKETINSLNIFYGKSLLPQHTAGSVIYRKKDRYQLVDKDGVYEISFQNKEFTQILKFAKINDKLNIKYGDIYFVKSYKDKNIVRFFPDSTEIIFNVTDPFYRLILHDDGKITTNIESNTMPGHCLSIRKPNQKDGSETWEEIAAFGWDCTTR